MVAHRGERVALMAIQPVYAQAILDGTKQVEFRKRTLAPDVRIVVIYETAPTQRIVGEFGVEQTVIDTPSRLWRQFRDVAGISATDYAKYFEGQASAVALRISHAYRYNADLALEDLHPRPGIPQSFIYVSRDAVAEAGLRRRAASAVGGHLVGS